MPGASNEITNSFNGLGSVTAVALEGYEVQEKK